MTGFDWSKRDTYGELDSRTGILRIRKPITGLPGRVQKSFILDHRKALRDTGAGKLV